ncbi:MAG TPA: T9SS type A sorting domain-containing protein [Bacteroidia bacterium]|nr:T9SS type A sorting domain-containing protein [Bacteroidia bacterium]
MKKIILYLYSVSVFCLIAFKANSQTFTSAFLQTGDGCTNLMNCMTTNSAGDIFAFWRDGSQTNNNSQYYILKWSSVTNSWTQVSTFDMTPLSAQTVFDYPSDDVSMVIDASGGYHVVFQAIENAACCGQRRGIAYGYSANGSSWTFTELQALSDPNGWLNVDDPTIDLDASGYPHVIYKYSDVNGSVDRYYAIEHRWKTAGGWQFETVAANTTGLSNEITAPDFVISPNGNLNVAFVRETNGSGTDGSLCYSVKPPSGVWTTTTVLAGTTGAAASTALSIQSSATSVITIINRSSTGAITEVTNASGSWVNNPIGAGLVGGINTHAFFMNDNGDKILGYKATASTSTYSFARKMSADAAWTTGVNIYADGNTNVARYFSLAANNSGDLVTLFDRLPAGGSCGAANQREMWYAYTTLPASCPTPTISLAGKTNVLCNGGSTGTATISVSGGSPFTYTWSPSGGSSAIASGLSAGTYTCAITNSCGATASQTLSITQPASALTTATAITNVLCNGGTTGSATITASGGTTGYTYLWSSAQTTSVITGLNSGVRTCTVTDANSCKATNTVTITQPSAISLSASASNPTICTGSSSTLTANASGGTGTINYTWVGGPTTNTYVVSPTSPTTYTVNVLDASNCGNSATVNVSANSCAAASALNFDGTNDYISIAYAETGTNITHEFWFKTTQANQGLFSVTDVNPTPGGFDRDLYLTSGNINAYVWLGGPAETITTSGTNYADGNWHHVAHVIGTSVGGQKLYVDGVLKASGTASASSFNWNTKILLGYSNTSPGNKYFNGNMDEVRIWNVARTQCEINSYKNCEIPTTASGLMANYHFNQGFDAGSNGTVTVAVDASGNSRNGSLTGFALNGAVSNWVAPGAVTTGSTTPANLTITVGATVSNSIICNGNSTILSGTGANTYNWTGGVTNAVAFSPTATATYTVIGTNTVTGCSNTAVASVTVNNCAPGAALNFDGTNDRVNLGSAITSGLSGGNKVTVEAWVKPTSFSGLGCIVGNYNTGVGALQILLRRAGNSYYEFWIGNGGSWFSTNSVATPSLNTWQHVAGTWDGSVASIYVNGVLSGTTTPALTVLGNASNNPVWIGANTINENFTGDVDEIRIWNRSLCMGEIQNNMNGEIPTTATGLLANYHFNQGLATGDNTAINTLTDASGNSNIGTLTNMSLNGTTSNWSAPGAVSTSVTPFVAPIISVNNGTICSGQSFTVTPSGASTYTVQGGSSVVSPSSNTTYTVVGSTSGCLSNVVASSVTVNSLPTVSVNSGAICAGESFTMVPSGATTYTYSNGSDVVAPSANDSYTVTGTNANGCKNTAVSSVTVNSLPTVSVNSGAICAGESFTMVPSGATTYTYSNGTDVVTPSANDSYTVTGTDANGCKNTTVSTVTVNILPVITTQPSNVTVCGNATGTFTVVATNGDTYSWGWSGNNVTFTNTNGTYGETGYTTSVLTVPNLESEGWDGYYIRAVVTSSNGCSVSSTSGLITVNSLPTVSVNSGAICAGESFTMVPSGATTYTYSNGSDVVTPSANDSYTVTGTDANGCENIAVSTVTVNALPVLTAVTNNTLLCVGQTATLSVNGATTYTWSTTENTTDIAVSPTVQTTYTVNGTDANGCENTTTVTQDVSLCTGITTLSNDASVNVYPNPSKGLFVIELTFVSKVTVMNALGQVVIEETFDAGKHTININNEATGVYFVKVMTNNKQQIIKLIKE